ncbi:MAG: tyrosine-type recombinase/integrase [Eubacteriales bacterium]
MRTSESPLIMQLLQEMQYRNYSPRTVKTYHSLLTKMERELPVSLDRATVEDLKVHLHHRIMNEKISVSMVNQYISVFKILQVDLLKRKWEPVIIKRPRREKKLPVVLSQSEVEKLIKATSNTKHKAILMLAYSSGLRRQEIKLIKPSAIDSARMQVHVVQGKGKKDRYTILSTKTLQLLRFYYKYERPLTYLFEPTGHKGQHLADETLNCIVKKSAAKAGIKKRVSFHTLRHCFATHLLEQGVNLRLIQEFLGHVSIKTTSVYLHLANIDPAGIISPLDTMNL